MQRGLPLQAVLAQFLAQRRAMDAQHRGSTALVAFAMAEHFDEERDLELAQRDLVQVFGVAAVEVAEITADGGRDMVAQGRARSGTRIVAIGSGVQAMSPGIHRRRSPDATGAGV